MISGFLDDNYTILNKFRDKNCTNIPERLWP